MRKHELTALRRNWSDRVLSFLKTYACRIRTEGSQFFSFRFIYKWLVYRLDCRLLIEVWSMDKTVLAYLLHYSFIHLVVCFTTGPKPLPKRALHIVRARASSFKWEYPFLSLRSFSSFLRLLPCLPVTSIPPCIFPSITRCRRQFLRKIWPIQFAFRLRISCRVFLCSLIRSNTS
jgi:hypothetical protein